MSLLEIITDITNGHVRVVTDTCEFVIITTATVTYPDTTTTFPVSYARFGTILKSNEEFSSLSLRFFDSDYCEVMYICVSVPQSTKKQSVQILHNKSFMRKETIPCHPFNN